MSYFSGHALGKSPVFCRPDFLRACSVDSAVLRLKRRAFFIGGGNGIVGPFLVPRSFRWTNADPFLHNRINRRTCHNIYDTWYCIATATWNFLISALWSWWTQHKNFIFLFLNINTVLSDSRTFRQHSHIKWNWIRSMTSETVRIHFLSDVFVCCHPEILLPWQRDATRSSLYLTGRMRFFDIFQDQILNIRFFWFFTKEK